MLTILFLLLIAAFTTIYSAFSWGTVLYFFWYWFLLPVFPSLPHVDLIQCMGLSLVVGLFHTQVYLSSDATADNSLLKYTAAPWISLILGWFLHLVLINVH